MSRMVILIRMKQPVPATIFLAEDDDDDAYLFELVIALTHPGYRILRFQNGLDLLAGLWLRDGHETSLIFLDVLMPGLDGMQTLRQIRQETSIARLPVFMLSASDAEYHINEAYTAGVDGYLIKPMSVGALSRLVKLAITYGMNLSQRA